MGTIALDIEKTEKMCNDLDHATDRITELSTGASGLQPAIQACWFGADSEGCTHYIGELTKNLNIMAEEVEKIRTWLNSYSEDTQARAAAGAGKYPV